MEVQSAMNKPHGHQDEPLGMTVYSMPEAGPSLVADGQRTVKGRWKMIGAGLARPVGQGRLEPSF